MLFFKFDAFKMREHFLKTGLRCYTCDTDGAGPKCIDNPDGLTQSDCTEGKDKCFTYRREEPLESGDPSKQYNS